VAVRQNDIDRCSVWQRDRMTNWQAWHEPYQDPDSPLSRRLALVRRHIVTWLDERPEPMLTVLSVCAGQGHDLLGVLVTRPDARRVRATLLESDPHNVEAAEAAVESAGLQHMSVVRVDAGDLASYAGSVPADLVLMAGVFGNISDADVHRTIRALPRLCAAGATVVWTRSRRAPDLTPTIRRWFEATGFVERAFDAPDDVLFSVGVSRFESVPEPLTAHGRLFTFLR